MHKRFAALLFIALIFIVTIVPAYCPPDDVLRPYSPACDIHSQPFTTAAGTFFDSNRHHGWTGVSLPWDISYRLPQYIPASTATRAPPA